MKFLSQIFYIFLFSFIGEILQALIPFPIPAAIYGLVLLLIALATGILKTSQVQQAAEFMISILTVLFVPICVRILEFWDVISQNAAAIISITVISTFLVFAVSGLVTQWIIKRRDKK